MNHIDPTRIPRGGPAVALVMRGFFALLAASTRGRWLPPPRAPDTIACRRSLVGAA
jgi:hypothetical protein